MANASAPPPLLRRVVVAAAVALACGGGGGGAAAAGTVLLQGTFERAALCFAGAPRLCLVREPGAGDDYVRVTSAAPVDARFWFNVSAPGDSTARVRQWDGTAGLNRCLQADAARRLKLVPCSATTWLNVRGVTSGSAGEPGLELSWNGDCVALKSAAAADGVSPDALKLAAGACGAPASAMLLTGFVTKSPTRAPSAPSFAPSLRPSARPSSAPTAPTATLPPSATRAPTAPTAPPIPGGPFFGKLLVLTARNVPYPNATLALGLESGDEFVPAPEERIVLKNYNRPSDHEPAHENKLIWTFTEDGQLVLTVFPRLAVESDHDAAQIGVPAGKLKYDNHLHLFTRSLSGAPLSPKYQPFRRWSMIPQPGGGVKVRLAISPPSRLPLCITVAECRSYVDPSPEQPDRRFCELDTFLPACRDGECWRDVCWKGYCYDPLQPAAFVKLMPCDADYDDVQVFELVEPDLGVIPDTPPPTSPEPSAAPTEPAPSTAAPSTAAPSTAAPSTAAPSTAAPSTAAPSTAAPTTRAPNTAAPVLVSDNNQDKSSVDTLALSLTLLLLCCLALVCLLVFLVRRKRRNAKKHRSQEDGDLLDGQSATGDDDDEQDFYNSFDTTGLYATPSVGRGPSPRKRFGSNGGRSHAHSSAGASRSSAGTDTLSDTEAATLVPPDPTSASSSRVQTTGRSLPKNGMRPTGSGEVLPFEQEQSYVARV
jgi:hypothetical protein